MDADPSTAADLLARRFEAHRTRLRAVAYRMLGSRSDADDAVQEAWLRLHRSDAEEIANLGGWLTTVVSRICLNVLAARRAHPGAPLDEHLSDCELSDPERMALLADSIGAALLVVLDTLTPAERLAFVLHDLFAVPFDRVADIIATSPANARQLASRARRRVQGSTEPKPDRHRQREVAAAFLAATTGGDVDALLTLLDPDVRLDADAAAAAMGAETGVRGARSVATLYAGRARAARLALIDGLPGLVWATHGVPQVLFELVIADGLVTAITLVADPDRVTAVDLVYV